MSSTPVTKLSKRKQPMALWLAVPYFEDLPEAIIIELANVAAPRHHAAGTIIFSEGDDDNGLYMVEEGTVKICRYSKDGREQTLNTFSAGDTFNDVAVLDGGRSPATALAFTDVILWRIARSDLQHLAMRHPALAWALIESIARRARYLVGLVQDLSLRSVKSRLAKLLLDQSQATEQDVVERMLTQEEMASRLGTVREVVGRALRSLAAAGVIEFDRHHIVILDVERLEEEAEI